MRKLSAGERLEIERRTASFDPFFEELMPVLTDFVERLEILDSPMVVAEPDRFVLPVDVFMKEQVIESEDRAWIVIRIGYLIGECLVQQFGGCWYVNDVPDSRYFARYVVGRFARIKNQNACVDPIAVADAYVSEPPGRSLVATLRKIEDELLAVIASV